MQDCRYRLVGVVNHQQNDGYKHYTALTLAKLDGSSGESSSKGPQLDNLKKRSRVNEAGQVRLILMAMAMIMMMMMIHVLSTILT
eukprot:jgi/Bigna1/60426/fgenesh1_kg.11_\